MGTKNNDFFGRLFILYECTNVFEYESYIGSSFVSVWIQKVKFGHIPSKMLALHPQFCLLRCLFVCMFLLSCFNFFLFLAAQILNYETLSFTINCNQRISQILDKTLLLGELN